MRLALVLLLAAFPALAQTPAPVPEAAPEEAAPLAPVGDPIPVPSGQEVRFLDTIQDAAGPAGLTLRFRFVAPAIAPGGIVDFETAAADMQALCDGFALPRVTETGPQPQQVVITLMDRPVAFGEAAPDVTQFFEAYRIEGGACVWEVF